MMRTTVNIPDDVYDVVRSFAEAERGPAWRGRGRVDSEGIKAGGAHPQRESLSQFHGPRRSRCDHPRTDPLGRRRIVKPYLLDINVLIALAWPNHVHHGEAMEWFLEKAVDAFRTCPITQTGFIRISSNPAFTANAATPAEALDLLQRVTELPGHGFWAGRPAGSRGGSSAGLVGESSPGHGWISGGSGQRRTTVVQLDRGISALAKHCPERLEIVGI